MSTKMKRITAAVSLLLLALVASGCASNLHPEPKFPPISAVPEITPKSAPRAALDGSLWNDSDAAQNFLFLDNRARNVNDVVTVIISETPTATQKADTQTARQSSPSASISKVLGLDFTKHNYLHMGSPPTIAASVNNSFKGSGSTDRSGSVLATISARVVQVLPNGNLVIRGQRAITINRETQYITLSGIVRPTDIDKDNTVQSARIADAQISYTGKGVLADQQGPGWLSRILDKIWPF